MESKACSICGGKFDIDCEGGIEGWIGVLPIALCPWCYNGTTEMFKQMCCEDCEKKIGKE